jgi:hypothetical protein
MSIFAQPAVSCNLEKVCALSWIWNKYTAEQISRVRSDIFGECQRG